ncbi:hypothetical protein KI387_007159, partial [Taxus chinensis]
PRRPRQPFQLRGRQRRIVVRDPSRLGSVFYDYDITFGLSDEEATLVLGGEVVLWSEQADGTVLDVRVWPRASAMAETLWSGNRDTSGKKRYAEATDRLNQWRYRMVGRGAVRC